MIAKDKVACDLSTRAGGKCRGKDQAMLPIDDIKGRTENLRSRQEGGKKEWECTIGFLSNEIPWGEWRPEGQEPSTNLSRETAREDRETKK